MRRTLSEKILMVINASVKETAGYLYPYKGFGGSFKKYRGSFSKAMFDLKEHGYLEEVELQNERYLKITSKGKLKLIKKKNLKNWDGLWRIIAFDIEEKRKKTRDVFRNKLTELGCQPFQKSVWIIPNDISSELEEIISILNIEKNVDYFIAKAMTNNTKYLSLFNLTE